MLPFFIVQIRPGEYIAELCSLPACTDKRGYETSRLMHPKGICHGHLGGYGKA